MHLVSVRQQWWVLGGTESVKVVPFGTGQICSLRHALTSGEFNPYGVPPLSPSIIAAAVF